MQRQTLNEAEEFPATQGRPKRMVFLSTLIVLIILGGVAWIFVTKNPTQHTSLIGAVVVADKDFTLTFKKRDGTCISIDTGSPGEHDTPVTCPTGISP